MNQNDKVQKTTAIETVQRSRKHIFLQILIILLLQHVFCVSCD